MQILGFNFKSKAEKERDEKNYRERVFPGGEEEREKVRKALTQRLPGKDEKDLMLCYVHIRDQMTGKKLSFEQVVSEIGKIQWLSFADQEMLLGIREVMEQICVGNRLELNTEENVLKESQADAKEQLSLFIDKELKEQAEELFGELGMSVEQAVVLFLKQAVNEQGIPFEIRRKK